MSEIYSHPDLFSTLDTLDVSPGRTRRDDHATSRAGAQSVAFRAGTQKAALLRAYEDVDQVGMTDEDAATRAGLSIRSCYWKRCGELRAAGLIEETGETSPGEAGVPRIVCRITTLGLRVLRDAE